MDYNNASDEGDPGRSHPIDMYVGSRVRLRRTLLGFPQGQIAKALGLTFQQVQKYERGANRIGASRLFELSRILSVPIAYFFDEMPESVSNCPPSGPRGRTSELLGDFSTPNTNLGNAFSTREALELLRSFYRITDKSRRKALVDLVNSLAKPSDVSV